MEIEGIDHIELYVADAARTVGELCESFGFAVHGRGGPETGLAGCTSILLRQGEIALLVTAAVDERHRAAEYVRRHGDGVAVIGLRVADASSAFAAAVARGAVPVAPPEEPRHGDARVTFASVVGFGDVEHRFISRDPAEGVFAPGLVVESAPAVPARELLVAVDHLAVCLPAGELTGTVRRYGEIFGLSQIFEERIEVGTQAMDSKVVQNPSRTFTLTVIEPDTSRDPGQIDAFVEAHGGPGVQHIAFRTEDIVAAVHDGSRHGLSFLSTPAVYYDDLPARLGPVGIPVPTLRELSILADRDHSGVMMQIFTASRHPRNTFFWELIDRRGARTFGTNNITALYEAVERRQAGDRAVLS